MLFTAGRTPTTESGLKGSRSSAIHWAQESFDQGSMVREWVKWDYELRPGVDLEGVVDRALALAGSWADHYGAAAMYLRLKGLLPPTAQKKPEENRK